MDQQELYSAVLSIHESIEQVTIHRKIDAWYIKVWCSPTAYRNVIESVSDFAEKWSNNDEKLKICVHELIVTSQISIHKEDVRKFDGGTNRRFGALLILTSVALLVPVHTVWDYNDLRDAVARYVT